ncbi:hypothetical protein ACWGI1_13145 [Streptomyces sp. NPDC054835]|uniref:hypothetical protein n=1 Tax=Streptomyces sp. NBC_01268 TaxID=2903806 RepID=UPI002E34C2D5|nr:hypothetical protein [Streptomyces sp. NBC_01268]
MQHDGREPAGFAAALQGLMADRAWDIPAADTTVLDSWPDSAASIAPQLSDHVHAATFHPASGQIDLRLGPPTYATQLRLITARIIAAANPAATRSAGLPLTALPGGLAGLVQSDPGEVDAGQLRAVDGGPLAGGVAEAIPPLRGRAAHCRHGVRPWRGPKA